MYVVDDSVHSSHIKVYPGVTSHRSCNSCVRLTLYIFKQNPSWLALVPGFFHFTGRRTRLLFNNVMVRS